MQHPNASARVTVILVVAAMLAVPMTAIATHNSVGSNAFIVQADEVDSDGQIIPDVPAGSPLHRTFHGNLDTPRVSPADQTGDGYTGDCRDATDPGYEAGLTTGESCYVGFIDYQWEYVLYLHPYLMKQPADPLYPANPAPDDEFCQDPANRASPECAGSGHGQFIPGFAAIDVNLVEAGFEGSQGAAAPVGVADVTGAETGSGTNVLPVLIMTYTFLFGQPHPDNEDPSPHEAGSGPFGPNPAEGGSPLTDISGACGVRTHDCKLLTPTDVKLYDDNADNLPTDITGEDSLPRVCNYLPQFTTTSATGGDPDDRDAGLCGMFGTVVNQFVSETRAGGFGIPGAPDTWVNLVPGWYEGAVVVSGGEAIKAANAALAPTGDGEFETTNYAWTAVNPRVPTPDHPLWCVRPNILATGDSEVAGIPDPGLYGSYIADAIDADVFTSPFGPVYRDYVDTVRPVTAPLVEQANGIVEDANGQVEEVLEQAELPPEVVDAATEAADRLDYLEFNEDASQVDPFTVTQEAGIRCDALGVPRAFDTPREIDGDLIHDVQVTQSTVSLKDPTLFTDGLPAGESETVEGAWMADQYSFGGTITAFLDTSEDAGEEPGAQFDGCATPNGQPQPDSDFCAWQAIWDAYNPECTDIEGESTCGEILDSRNYDLEEGVGLRFVAKVSGPVIVSDEDITANAPPRPNEITGRTAVLGLNDPTAQNCIVGFSMGLADRVDDEAIVEDACGDVLGETFVIEDAFDDQSASNPGGFSAAVDITKLTPTPSAVVDATEIGAGDELCVTSLFSVEADRTASDTLGLEEMELTGGSSGTTYSWSDCFAFESTLRS